MNAPGDLQVLAEGVLAPKALLARPETFGGADRGDCLAGDLLARGGQIAGLRASAAAPRRLILPRLVEPHVHLDKCHTIDRLSAVGGDLRAAIAAQSRDIAAAGAKDIHERALRGLGELHAAGCGLVRSHVDWSGPEAGFAPPAAWSALREIRAGLADPGSLQLAALTGADDLADAAVAAGVARDLARDEGVLGCFVLDQGVARAPGVRNAFAAAERYGLALDFHVDEGLGEGLDGLELIADAALETSFAGPVLCGHACSLMNRNTDETRRISEKLARAGVVVVSLPTSNLYLQGRGAGTPARRGLTRIHELRAAGVTVALGADNVRDAFCPIGRLDPLHTLSVAVLAAHLDPPFGAHLELITTAAARGLGRAPVFIDEAGPEGLIAFDVASTSELLAGAPRPAPLSAIVTGPQK